jgi:ParD-like antitoxin of type II bacterial toxin-antitoxin system
MPAVAVKLSSSIALAARKAAKVADRSLTAQIEHWARLGMQVDEELTGSAMLTMKKGNWSTDGQPQEIKEIQAYLNRLSLPGNATELSLASGILEGETTYSRENGVLIRTNPDGTETPGQMKGKTFVPFPEPTIIPLPTCLIYGKSILIQIQKAA